MRCAVLLLVCLPLTGCGALVCGGDPYCRAVLGKPGAPARIENVSSNVWTAGTIRVLPDGEPMDLYLEQPLMPGDALDLGVYDPGQYEIRLTGHDPQTLAPRAHWTEWSGGVLVIDQ